MIRLLISIIILFQFASSNVSFGNDPTEKKRKLKLVWSDEFKNDGAPDTTNWTFDIGHGHDGWGNQELQYYTNTSDNVYVKDGKLIIEAKKKDGKWTSARVKSQGKRSFKEGKIVFRAKLANGKGTWPALWLLGEKISSVGWPACGEIDVMEHVGRNPTIVQCAMHTPASHGNTQYVGKTTVESFDSEFHDYAVDWTEDQMQFSVDGRVYYTYKPEPRDEASWPFEDPFFMIMNIAIGGGLGGEVDPALEFARMEVDYVRVYQTPTKK